MTKVLKIYTRVILFLVPFLFLPVIYDSFGLGKSAIVWLSGMVGLVLWGVSLLVEKKNELRLSKWWWWGLILLVWSTISFFKMTIGGQARSMTSPLGFGGLLGLMIWFFLWLQVRSKDELKIQMVFLSLSAAVVSVISLIVFLIPTSKLPLSWPTNNPIVSIGSGWSITGSLVSEVALLLVVLINWLGVLMKKIKTKSGFNDYFKEAIYVAFFGLVFLLDAYRLVKQGWIFLDLRSAWVIAAETLKNSPIFGVGLGNFIEAFSRFRPTSFNMTPYWASNFGVSSMGLLNWWTELGTVGLFIVMAMMFLGWKKKNESGFLILAVLGLLNLFLPPTFVGLFLLFWTLGLVFGETKEIKMILPVGAQSFNIMPYILLVLILVGSGFGGTKVVKMVVADYYWKESLLAATKNNGTDVYNMQIKAIGKNPSMADYRAVYSQTNLALAQAILTSAQGKELTAEDKEKASTLIQQAVREGQAAVSLDKNIATYWSNLGSVYKALVGVVDNSLNWSVQSYQQAALLDPANPSISMELGSVAYGAGDYASAERYFEDAVKDKSDYANAWYNWAYALKQQNKLQDAVSRLDQALKLVPAEGSDYTKGKEELDKWNKELEAAVKQYQEQLKQQQEAQQKSQQQVPNTNQKSTEPLTTPQPLPTEGSEERVNVPAKDLEPPQSTVTPAP